MDLDLSIVCGSHKHLTERVSEREIEKREIEENSNASIDHVLIVDINDRITR